MLATSGAGTSCPSGAHEFTPGFSGERVTRSLVMFCRSLFVLFLLAIVMSGLRFTDSDYPFGIFKLFLNTWLNKTLNHPDIQLCVHRSVSKD